MAWRPKGLIAMSTIRRVTNIAIAAFLGLTVFVTGANVAAANRTNAHITALAPTWSVPLGPVNSNETALIATATNLHVAVMPYQGEGIIHLVTRVCGTAKNWQSVAADNHIKPTQYIVPFQVAVQVDCASTTKPASAPTGSTPTTTSSGWTSPLPGTCRPPYGGGQFGAPRDGGARLHQGIDLGRLEHKKVGTPILAAAAGTVFVSGWVSGNAGYGVEIRHANGVVTKYFHMTRTGVKNGQQVKAGQVIGYMGATGDATGPHLHFEVWVNGTLKNAAKWLDSHNVRMTC